jgi:hypothetical protein
MRMLFPLRPSSRSKNIHFIGLKLVVRCEDGYLFNLGLRDEKAIERIPVMIGQSRRLQCMTHLYREWSRQGQCHATWNELVRRLRKLQLSDRVLNRDFPRADGGKNPLIPRINDPPASLL